MEEYKDRTGKFEFKATLHKLNISDAYRRWLDKHNDELISAFDAFRAGAEYIESSNSVWISAKDRRPSGTVDECFACTRNRAVMLVHYE